MFRYHSHSKMQFAVGSYRHNLMFNFVSILIYALIVILIDVLFVLLSRVFV